MCICVGAQDLKERIAGRIAGKRRSIDPGCRRVRIREGADRKVERAVRGCRNRTVSARVDIEIIDLLPPGGEAIVELDTVACRRLADNPIAVAWQSADLVDIRGLQPKRQRVQMRGT